MRSTSKILASFLCVSLLVVTSTPCAARTGALASAESHGELRAAEAAEHHSPSGAHDAHANHSAHAGSAGHEHHAGAGPASEDSEAVPQLGRPCACGCGDVPAERANANVRVGFALRGETPASATPFGMGVASAFEQELPPTPTFFIDPDPV